MESIYAILVDGRERDARRFWIVFGVFGAINGVLFGAVVASGPPRGPTLAACGLGAASCLLWIGGALRTAAWTRWWEDRLARLEPEVFAALRDGAGDASAGRLPSWFTVFEERRLDLGFNGLPTQVIGWLLPALFLAAWIALAWLELLPADAPPPRPPPDEPADGSFL